MRSTCAQVASSTRYLGKKARSFPIPTSGLHTFLCALRPALNMRARNLCKNNRGLNLCTARVAIKKQVKVGFVSSAALSAVVSLAFRLTFRTHKDNGDLKTKRTASSRLARVWPMIDSLCNLPRVNHVTCPRTYRSVPPTYHPGHCRRTGLRGWFMDRVRAPLIDRSKSYFDNSIYISIIFQPLQSCVVTVRTPESPPSPDLWNEECVRRKFSLSSFLVARIGHIQLESIIESGYRAVA